LERDARVRPDTTQTRLDKQLFPAVATYLRTPNSLPKILNTKL
jgi:hypothetical protein